MEKHQVIALGIFLTVGLMGLARDGLEMGFIKAAILGLFVMPILFYRVIAYLSGFGFPEVFARDYGSENHPGPYALFFWILFIIACCFVVFDGSLL